MRKITLVATTVLMVAGTGFAFTDEGAKRFKEFLSGLNEAPAVVSTSGSGTFRATIGKNEDEINYTLTFNNLEGDVRQGHIHIGLPQNAGSIVLWLCDSATNPSPVATTPACTENNPLDTRSGEVSGTLTKADVQALPGNGIAGPTDFAEVIALIRAGKTYVNVHSAVYPSGEVRSQLEHDQRNIDHP